jgi:hypothetical protein
MLDTGPEQDTAAASTRHRPCGTTSDDDDNNHDSGWRNHRLANRLASTSTNRCRRRHLRSKGARCRRSKIILETIRRTGHVACISKRNSTVPRCEHGVGAIDGYLCQRLGLCLDTVKSSLSRTPPDSSPAWDLGRGIVLILVFLFFSSFSLL